MTNTIPATQGQSQLKYLQKLDRPKIRLEKTTDDFEAWKQELLEYLELLQVTGRVLTEAQRITEAKNMIGEHTGPGAYYTYAQEYSSTGITLEMYLARIQYWHNQRRRVLDPTDILLGDHKPLDVFMRPLGWKMSVWLRSPYLRQQLKKNYRLWPRENFFVGKIMDTIVDHSCHVGALIEYRIKQEGEFGGEWNVEKIRADAPTPEDFLAILEKWVDVNGTLEAHFQTYQKGREERRRKEDEEFLLREGLATTHKLRTKAVGATEGWYEEAVNAAAAAFRGRRESYPYTKGTTEAPTRLTTPPTAASERVPCPKCMEVDGVERTNHDVKTCWHVTGGPKRWRHYRARVTKNATGAE